MWHNYLFESGHHERAAQVLVVISKATRSTITLAWTDVQLDIT